MGALSRFSDSLEEMESSCPHPGGHRDASRATGRPFPWLEDCALLADPLGFARKQHFSFQEGAPPCLAHLTWKCVCVCEHSALQLTPALSPIPSLSQLLECPDVFQSLYSVLHACPGQDCKLRCCLKGRKEALPSTPTTWIPVTFPVGPMRKDPQQEWYLLELSIAWTSVSQISVKALLGRDLSRKSLGKLHFISCQEGHLPAFLPQWILSDKDERRNWANSAMPPVKTSTTPS